MNKNQISGFRWAYLGVALMMVWALAGCEILPRHDRPVVQNMEPGDDAQAAKSETAAVSASTESITPSNTTSPSPVPASAHVSSTINEVRHLIQTRNVRELRTTYNGNYGASLLFRPDDLMYYAVLFENRNVWRVIKTDNSAAAEKAYGDYVTESAQLAQAGLDRIRLEARYNSLEHELVSKAEELTSLQHDMDVQRQQEMVIKSEQAQMRSDVELLAQQEKETQEQLKILQLQIKALQAQRRGQP